MIGLLLVVASVLFIVHQFYWRRRKYPAGPIPFPIVGNSLELMKAERWEVKFLEWRERYGNVYTYFMGTIPIVSINSYDAMVELFVKQGDLTADRYSLEAFNKVLRGGSYGIIDTSGYRWQEQRRFALKTLRNFGLSKNKMEDRVIDELETTCARVDELNETGGGEIDFNKLSDLATGSVINSVVCGFRFSDGNEKQFYKLKETLAKIIKANSEPVFLIAAFSDKMLNLPIVRNRLNEIKSWWKELVQYVEETIDKHEKHIASLDSDDVEPRDFIDSFILERRRLDAKGEAHYYSRDQMINVILDLFTAGQETTSAVITWGVAYLIRHPQIQARVHKELDAVIGSDRVVTMADRSNLPYTTAMINEVMRCSNIIAQNLMRMLARDVTIDGVFIPAGSVILPQISVLMADPKIYDQPDEFNPTRFLDANGQLKKQDELLTFSIGKRQCPGEGLARMELHCFLANFFNRYTFKAGKTPPTLRKQLNGASLSTELYSCVVTRRH